MAKIENLKDLYVHELKDAYDFEHQILKALPKMEKKASSQELKAAFKEHLKVTERQVKRLEQVFQDLGQKPTRVSCKGMKGLIEEGEEYMKNGADPDALDAALILAAQRVEHYEMAVYGTLCAYAKALGHENQAAILHETLEEETRTDEELTKLAKSTVNLEALPG
jgi:ferritin-like metal-binding protein YciE